MMQVFAKPAATRQSGLPWTHRAIAALLLALTATLAHATCTVHPNDFTPLSFGALTADASVPAGQTIATQSRTIHVTCTKPTSGATVQDTLTFQSGYGMVPLLGSNLWATTQPGVGVRMTLNGNVISRQDHDSVSQAADGSRQPYALKVELVKIGPVRPTASFTPTIVRLLAASAGGMPYQIGLLGVVATMFNGVACTIANDSLDQNVALGKLTAADFHGAGSMAGTKPVSLNLRCDSYGDPIPTPLSIRFDGTSVPSQPDLLSVSGSPAATGLGIQLHWSDTGKPVPLHEWIPRGTTASGRQTMNLEAGYYQYAPQITPGGADGMLTFTIEMR
ncbi:hypothetical protein WJ96_20460 [Burkholderia ubonensis]|uniref:Fimbrial-type adhesion domain-containing protein n=1 Tax=Burkholderia ubonensis TaxID=101571 RepID=A0AAW3MR64_9BURK|nr:fimbrial protein [Burkholderia ubonensis]KVN83132.1 hypothetical protein WJ67_04495 [Burkholderia ubonensis]KVO39534.1 hypothetical protein WJ75_08460 [Burkholderia ubonensis]KVP89366.1 hypothetical protein WJ96_20460 [Burkholderia ubonensis]KWD49500.1 hypothetical protein WL66_20080 [Burkholderia ubonensis]KWD67930.1 hypothetical protein WL67_28225 [Burkholderia ubonensis]